MHKVDETWCIHYNHYNPADEGRREALLALGNGFLISRAAASEAKDDSIHYPGTYQAGCYNELTSRIQGQDVKNESIVNLPNWLPLSFRIDGGSWFSLDEVSILTYEQTLDMQHGLLSWMVRFVDRQGNQTLLQERRFVSMASPHLLALAIELTAENWSGNLEICSGLDGRIQKNKVKRYAPFNRQHLETLNTCAWAEYGMELLCRTTQSDITVALAARTQVHVMGRETQITREAKPKHDYICTRLQVALKVSEKVVIEKVAALYSSLYNPADECSQSARNALQEAPGFEALLSAHRHAWEQLWKRCQLNMDNKKQLRNFRLHIFQMLQNFSPHTAKLDAGVPPNGWQGEEYHGQVLWDELLVCPFLVFHFPDSARVLLHYRYRRLEAARQLAKQNGYRGAMFPWRSASDGHEEPPSLQLNPLSGRWMEDYTFLQRHIGAIVAFNTWYYVKATDDQQFQEDFGAELFLEIARFWTSIATYNAASEWFEINRVAGPDEYHTLHPVTQKPDLSNNTYTNIMAVWILSHARTIFDKLPPKPYQELQDKLGLSARELEQWETISRKMQVIFTHDGASSQFEGFDQLKKFDLQAFHKQHGKQRLDWALEKMGDSVDRYQITKQADTPLLLYLFSPTELIALFARLGFSVDEEVLQRTLTNHLAYTTHESSLSRIVYAGALAHFDKAASWEHFKQVQQVDLSPEDKGTAEGIHLGAMGGTLAVLQQYYLGCKMQSGKLEINPALPEFISWLRYSMCFRGKELLCEVS